MMKKIANKLIFSFFLFLLFYAYSADAEIVSFLASPSSINSGQQTSLVWSSQNSSAVKLILPCVRGIKYFSESDVVLACDSAMLDLSTSGALNIKVVNLNTIASSLQVKIVSKDAYGTYEEGGSVLASISVGPASTIITDFTASPIEIESGNEIVFSWSSQYVDGVNFNFSCMEGLKITYTGDSRSFLPCGVIVFLNNSGASGQISLKFVSEGSGERLVNISVVPAMADGTYDATRSKSVDIKVRPRAPKISKLNLYSTALKTIPSGSSTVISWGGENISGVNFIYTCVSGIIATSSLDATSTLPCDSYVFSNNLPATSSISVAFRNTGFGTAGVSLKIIPYLANNTYDTTRAVDIRLDVLNEGAFVPVLVSAPLTQNISMPPPVVSLTPEIIPTFVMPPPNTSATSTQLQTPPSSLPRDKFIYSFFRPLYSGLENDYDVMALQKILTSEGVYSGPVTGNYYNLTVQAVKKFQQKYGISQLGNVGPGTRAKLNELYSESKTSVVLPSPSNTIKHNFQKSLYLGLENDPDVKVLQQILVLEGVYSGPVTGSYYNLTFRAVKKFQEKYGITSLGNVGPKTREKLNALYSR